MFERDPQGEGSFVRSTLQSVLRLLLGRDLTAAWVRFILAGIALAAFWLILIVIFQYPGQIPYDLLSTIPPLLFPFVNIASTFFNPQILLHLLPVFFGIAAGIAFGALYLRDLFEIESPGTAFRYLLGSLFGLSYPRLRIDRQNVQQLEAHNPITRIGGPGYLQINLGFAAIFETVHGIPNVYPRAMEAHHGDDRREPPTATRRPAAFLEGFERLREVVDLRDRIVRLEQTYAETRDGVPLAAVDVQMVFRVYGGGQERNLANAYPFHEESIRRLVYAQPILEKRARTPDELLARIAERELQAFVRSHSLESLLALQPYRRLETGVREELENEDEAGQFQIPRRALTEHFHTEALTRRLRYLGLELDWIGVGIWQVGLAPSAETRGEIDPGRTLLSAWRDYQRLQLYRSPAFLERQRFGRVRDLSSEMIQGWIGTWERGELGETYRCYELLSLIERQLEKLQASVEEETETGLAAARAIAHLERLNRPHVLGRGDGE
jgi:hypothetical protein